ncbi:LAT2 domain-containing protein isoform X2 [Labeo rohita]|uniref:LAT2 domain-containing protein isoform X2 n=1 Tax=Labeo rohita TaxID=84645 RepID=UPI0021E31AB5|nr:LAT2 domain-containing protein isoform X2 [Labeo rohita]
MIEVQSQQGVLLAIVSVACLGCVYALCVCCRKKSSMQQEDNDLYDQDDFSQDYAESRKTSTVPRPTQREMSSTSRRSPMNRPLNRPVNSDHWSYQNVPDENGILEPTYVDPIPDSLYANEDDPDQDQNPDTGYYGNVFPTTKVQHDSDSCDYENWDQKQEEDEPDYVNEITR